MPLAPVSNDSPAVRRCCYNAQMALENPRSRLQLPLLWLLIFALTSSVVHLLRQVSADYWRPTTLIIAVASAWGIITTRYLTALERWKRNALAYRAAEVVMLAVLLRLVLWMTFGFPQGNRFNDYLRDPFIILDDHWWVHFIFVLIVWSWSNAFTALLNQLDFSEFELNMHAIDQRNLSALQQSNRSQLLIEYFNLWVGGGMLLILVTALATYRLSEFQQENWFGNVTRLALPPQLLINLLLYLFIGLWLLSYVRYIVLFSRWLYRGVRPQAALARVWRRGGFVLLTVIAILCALLPIGSTMPIVWFGRMLYYFFYIVASAAIRFIGWLLAFFRGEEELGAEPLMPEITIPPMEVSAENFSQREPLIPPELTGGLTWVLIIIAIIAALIVLTRGQSYGRITHLLQQLGSHLREWWQQMRKEIDGRVADIRHIVQEQFGRSPIAKKSTSRLFHLNALTPREQIRYFYLATVKRASERGVQRSQEETPVEFLDVLKSEFPESADDTDALTSAFLHARYSNHEVAEATITPVKKRWKRIKRTIRHK